MRPAAPVIILFRMVPEPRNIARRYGDGGPANLYEGRWKWWYSSIADWMLANPGGSLKQCAEDLGRAYSTICFITSSDTYKTYFAQRKEEFQAGHNLAITSKLHQVAEKSLDTILKVLEKRGDQIPLNIVTPLATGALDRLGFAPKTAPQVAVNVQNNTNQQVVLPAAVTVDALEEARQALRAIEAKRAEETRLLPAPEAVAVPPSVGAELASMPGEVVDVEGSE